MKEAIFAKNVATFEVSSHLHSHIQGKHDVLRLRFCVFEKIVEQVLSWKSTQEYQNVSYFLCKLADKCLEEIENALTIKWNDVILKLQNNINYELLIAR